MVRTSQAAALWTDKKARPMLIQMVKPKRRQVLLDINTQRDFLLVTGRACVRNHRRVLAHIRRVMAWARLNRIPIISTCQAPTNGLSCAEPNGLAKVSYTLVDNRIWFAPESRTDLPVDLMRRYQQVILEKRTLDPFDEPRIDRLLTELKVAEFIIIGTTTEGEIQATALGLIQRHRLVTVVTDAIGCRDANEAQMAIRKMQAKGVRLIETRRLAGISHLRTIGACPCQTCRKRTAKDDLEEPASFRTGQGWQLG
ncbi:MAG: isochorismatase family protein [Sedimentisphaerales bacterium]|nr:isochorismatase family protein [Sedimentisphaerales bacterium]